jgi:3-hydroxyisobutyrate dehydrogenase
MGMPMCAALAGADHEVTATDKRPEQKAAALACGAAWRDSPAQAAAEAEVLITVLPGPREVHQAMLGAGGALRTLAAGAAWIDMTSNSPDAARPIRELAQARGVEVLEAPVGGGVQAARERRLLLFAGGDARVLDKHRPLLEVLAGPDRIAHVGAHGAGYTVKLLVNLLWFGQAVATAEALLLAKRTGVDPRVLRDALNASAAASHFVRCDLPALFRGDYLASFGLDGICQELATVTELAHHHRVPFELADQVHRTYQRALARYGAVDGELLAVALLEEEAGLDLLSRPPDGPAKARSRAGTGQRRVSRAPAPPVPPTPTASRRTRR